jgi:cell wall-associated NlpC family hydrolase
LNARICLYLSTIPLTASLLLAPLAPAEPPPPIPGADAAVARAESLLGTDRFGPYGCEALVAYAYDVPQGKYGWDGASETMYQTLLAQGLIHTDMNPPRGALVFSRGSDGPHVDLARGDGTFVSAGVQGLSRGYGDKHNIQILPTANVGKKWTYRGWSLDFPK